MRSIWKGAISFGLVTIPVKLYSATEAKDVASKILGHPLVTKQSCPQGRVVRRVYVEVKGNRRNRVALLTATIALVRQFRMENRVTLIAFDHAVIERVRTLATDIKTAPILAVHTQ